MRRAILLVAVMGLAAGACSTSLTVTSSDARPASGDSGTSTTAGRRTTTVPRTTVGPATTTEPGTTTTESEATTTEPGTSAAPTTTTPAGASLDWGSCDQFADDFVLDDMLGSNRDDLECATLEVPLDYGDPNGPQIALADGRRPAEDEQHRIGSLVINPGGPGGSGLEFLPQFVDEAGQDVLDQFDIVSFDPRGVAASTPINCLTNDEREASSNQDPTPDDAAELTALLQTQHDENASCARQFPDLVPRMGTNNVARDLDRLREALGDDQLTYLGFSYGTLIGAVYAQLFPERVRAMVLDGTLSPAGTLGVLRDGQFEGFRRTFDHFVQACADDQNCPLDDARASVEQLLAKAAASPIPTGDARPLTEARAYTAVSASLYDRSSWDFVWQAIADALDDDALILGLVSDLYVGRRPDGSWSNIDEAFNAVTCADYAERPTLEEVMPRAQEILAADSLWGPAFAYNSLGCDGAAPAVDPVAFPLTAPGAPPIVVVGTTGDPATPYEWAQQMAASLESAVLVTYDGDGHTAYGRSKCATDIVDEYLLSASAPGADQTCSS